MNCSTLVLHSTMAATLLLTAYVPVTAQADGNYNSNRPITVYFTRHAEKKTTTIDLGTATTVYNDSEGSSKGKNRDDECGTSKCAEELDARGLHRANLLADWFARRGIVNKLDAVYSSHKRRTYQTVLPTATIAGLEVQQLPVDGTELNPESTTPSECLTIEAILNASPGDTLLVAGHSGTLYDIMGDGNSDCAGLGLLTDADPSSNRFPKNDDNKVADFGDVWKVVIRNGVAKFRYRVNLDTDRLRVQNRAY